MPKTTPSWIRHLGFQNFSKTPENRPKLLKYSKSIKQCSKNLKEVKIIELKLIFINGKTKISNLENMSVEMTLPWQRQVPDITTYPTNLFSGKF